MVKKIVPYEEVGILLGEFPALKCEACGEILFDEETAGKIQARSKEKGLFGIARKAKVAEIGNSLAIRVPKELAEFLKLSKGKEVLLMPKTKQDLVVHVS
jgi:YgiT-type zinc finger domain-containing protein